MTKSLKNITYAGIDPGFTGAIAILSHDGQLIEVYDAPTRDIKFQKNGKVRNRSEFMPDAMIRIFKDHNVRRAAIESVTARSGQGVVSMFRFGHGLGLWQGIMSALNIEWMCIPSIVWKRKFELLNEDKDASRILAAKHFPNADLRLKKYHGRADALLLAEYVFNAYERINECVPHLQT